MTFQRTIFGNSQFDPRGNTDRLCAPYILAAVTGEPKLVNRAVGGRGIAEQFDAVVDHTQIEGDEHIIMFHGDVDAVGRVNNDGTPKTGATAVFQQIYAATLAWLTTDKTLITDTSKWTLSGTWQMFSTSWVLFWPRVTWTPDDYATIVSNGAICDIGYLMVDNSDTSFTVYIDDVEYGTYPVAPPCTIQLPGSSRFWAPAVLQIDGVVPGSVIKIKKNAGSDGLFLTWFGHTIKTANIFLLTMPNNADAIIQARADAYNVVIADFEAANVEIVHAGEIIDPAYDMFSGGDVHLAAGGQAKYAAALKAAGA